LASKCRRLRPDLWALAARASNVWPHPHPQPMSMICSLFAGSRTSIAAS
jgi:hypothetical protein